MVGLTLGKREISGSNLGSVSARGFTFFFFPKSSAECLLEISSPPFLLVKDFSPIEASRKPFSL